MGKGPDGGHCARVGEALRERFAAYRIDLQLVSSAGPMDNIRGLLAGDLDVALVQSGNLSDTEAAQFESVAAIFYEPVLFVYRGDWDTDIVAGGRIAIGVPALGPLGAGRRASRVPARGWGNS